MNQTQAQVRYQKLRSLADPDRGGTPAERAVAAGKARSLLERFPGITRPAKRRVSAGTARGERRVYYAPVRGPAQWRWGFDPVTGAASKNVKVHYHTDRGNWKIEIDLSGQPSAIGKGVDEGERELDR